MTLGSTAGAPSYARPTSTAGRIIGRNSPLWRTDWVLTVCVVSLSVIGALLVWSATRERQLALHASPDAYLKKHLLNLGIGLGLAVFTAVLDHRMLRAYVPIVYVASMLGLVAVLSPLGITINGAHSWIYLPAGFEIQPAEFAKVALVAGMALLLSEKRDTEDAPRDIDVLQALLLCAMPLGLIMLQPDLGSALVLAFIVVGVVAASGAPARWVAGLVLVGVLGATVAIEGGVLHTYQRDRLLSFVDPNADPQGSGYNTRQARIAIGSGGLTGEGLFHGKQTQGRFVPEQQTDFVFTVAGEELGFLGASGIIALFGLLLWRAGRIAARAEDLFGRLVAVGVICWFAFQVFENVGMTLGIMPVTGLPLPFVSYGGSNMFANMMAIGLLQNVYMRRSA